MHVTQTAAHASILALTYCALTAVTAAAKACPDTGLVLTGQPEPALLLASAELTWERAHHGLPFPPRKCAPTPPAHDLEPCNRRKAAAQLASLHSTAQAQRAGFWLRRASPGTVRTSWQAWQSFQLPNEADKLHCMCRPQVAGIDSTNARLTRQQGSIGADQPYQARSPSRSPVAARLQGGMMTCCGRPFAGQRREQHADITRVARLSFAVLLLGGSAWRCLLRPSAGQRLRQHAFECLSMDSRAFEGLLK